jgi:hypothetical protein
LTAVAPYEVREQSFVLSRQNVLQRALKCLTIDELNPELLAEQNEITPGARVAFDELTNELPDSSCRLPNGGAPFALPDFDLFVQLTLQGELHVPRN